jgi:hypothetical protein
MVINCDVTGRAHPMRSKMWVMMKASGFFSRASQKALKKPSNFGDLRMGKWSLRKYLRSSI